MDEEGGLADKSKGNEIPVMYTGLYHQVPTPEENGNYVTHQSCFQEGITMLEGR